MAIEGGVGVASNALSLIGDACHMLFDCAAIGVGLAGTAVARAPRPHLHMFL